MESVKKPGAYSYPFTFSGVCHHFRPSPGQCGSRIRRAIQTRSWTLNSAQKCLILADTFRAHMPGTGTTKAGSTPRARTDRRTRSALPRREGRSRRGGMTLVAGSGHPSNSPGRSAVGVAQATARRRAWARLLGQERPPSLGQEPHYSRPRLMANWRVLSFHLDFVLR